MNKIVAIIPARSKSKGVPNKNIRMLCGHPVLAYSIMAAKKTKFIEDVFISTDSQEYIDIAKEYQAKAPFVRPDYASSDTATDSDVVLHFLDWYKSNYSILPEYLVHLRPTTPLRDPKIIDEAIKNILVYQDSCTALRSVHEMAETAYKCFEIEGGYLKTMIEGSFDLDRANNARQQFPKTYSANGYVDILKTDFILQNKKIHGNKVLSYLTSGIVEIDTEENLAYLEYQIARNNKLFNRLFGV